MALLFWMLLFGVITGAVAQAKGRDALGWGVLGALLFIVALPVLLLSPPLPPKSGGQS